jgi:hypothetical protein
MILWSHRWCSKPLTTAAIAVGSSVLAAHAASLARLPITAHLATTERLPTLCLTTLRRPRLQAHTTCSEQGSATLVEVPYHSTAQQVLTLMAYYSLVLMLV